MGHVVFYLKVLLDGNFREKEIDEINWADSWKVQSVNMDEWQYLKKELIDVYRELKELIRIRDCWSGEDDIGASFAILAHTAYHLGGIRQLINMM